MPTHHCAQRSEIARACSVVFTQPVGMPPLRWAHQFMVQEGQPVAIRYCPFCGVELELEHFV